MEEWRPIPGYGGWYEVSNLGNVRSYRKRGQGKGRKEIPTAIRQGKPRNGYRQAGLYMHPYGSRPFYVHRLVLEAFVGPCPEGWEGSHENGIRSDNRLSNLLWESKSDNNQRKRKHGTAGLGSKNPFAKLTEEQVQAIRERYAAGGVTQTALAKEHGVSQAHVSDVCTGRRGGWAHAEGPQTSGNGSNASKTVRQRSS